MLLSKRAEALRVALGEAEEAVGQVMGGKRAIELSPASAYVRRLQHLLAERHHLSSRSLGKEPRRRVKIFKGDEDSDLIAKSPSMAL